MEVTKKDVKKLIDNSEKIVINLHRSPDYDSLASAFSLLYFLKKCKKRVTVISPAKVDFENMEELGVSFEKIKEVRMENFDFSKFDLFIVLDSSSWFMVTGIKDFKPRFGNCKVLVIDHHLTNEFFGDYNFVDPNFSSCSELIYDLFKSWGFKINKYLANLILLGLYGDTGGLLFSNTNLKTFEYAFELLKKGADKNLLVRILFKSYKPATFRAFGLIFSEFKIDKKNHLAYLKIDLAKSQRWSIDSKVRDAFCSLFLNAVAGMRLGIFIHEEVKNIINVSLRARDENIDISRLAKEMGGGGHKLAAGAQLYGDFKEVSRFVIRKAREFLKEDGKKF